LLIFQIILSIDPIFVDSRHIEHDRAHVELGAEDLADLGPLLILDIHTLHRFGGDIVPVYESEGVEVIRVNL
jgi:hypothetical protein